MSAIPAPTIIQAQPGWFHLSLDAKTGELFGHDPVLAWEIVPMAYLGGLTGDDGLPYLLNVYPITTIGRLDDDEILYLLRPDGRVEEVASQDWATLELANATNECAARIRSVGPTA